MGRLKKEALASNYYEKLLLLGVMEYHGLKKRKITGLEMEVLEKLVKQLLSENSISKELVQELAKAREGLMTKADILTAYIDKLEIYQYVLNRIELRFAKEIKQPQEEAFVEEIMEAIFSVRDNAVINESIKAVLGQLPVRMTKEKYFDRVYNGILVYQGADKASADAMLYDLWTGSMVYQPKMTEIYYTDYKKIIEEFEKLDDSALTKEVHHEMEQLLEETGEKLMMEMDTCMFLAEAVNHFYGAFLVSDLAAGTKELQSKLHSLLEMVQKGILEEAEEELSILDERVEVLLEKEERLEKGLLEADFEEAGIKELLMAQALDSESPFTEFNFEEEESVADRAWLEQEAGKLIDALKKRFCESSLVINRAIMANTLSKLPVFFQSSEELEEYIQNSLAQCQDIAEKVMSMKLIYHIMEG